VRVLCRPDTDHHRVISGAFGVLTETLKRWQTSFFSSTEDSIFQLLDDPPSGLLALSALFFDSSFATCDQRCVVVAFEALNLLRCEYFGRLEEAVVTALLIRFGEVLRSLKEMPQHNSRSSRGFQLSNTSLHCGV